MNKLKKVHQEDGIAAYDCDNFLYIELDKGAIASDHEHSNEETIYLLKGEVEFTLGDKTEIIKSPIKLVIPKNTYHKFKALTDVIGIELKN